MEVIVKSAYRYGGSTEHRDRVSLVTPSRRLPALTAPLSTFLSLIPFTPFELWTATKR